MEISLNSVSQSMPSLPPTEAGATAAAAKKAPDNWITTGKGVSEISRVAGEEAIDERAFRRDDDLGRLVDKAFDPATSAAALPKLGILPITNTHGTDFLIR